MQRFFVLFFLFFINPLLSENNPLDYYKLEFGKPDQKGFHDTLFKKYIWHKKVSHIIIEDKSDYFFVTILMILPYPHNYKSENYPLHYKFNNFQDTFNKFKWLNEFLKKNGVLEVTIRGNLITNETVLYNMEN